MLNGLLSGWGRNEMYDTSRMKTIDKVCYNPLYVLLIMLFVIPYNVYMMLSGWGVAGFLLFMMQMPWFVTGVGGKFRYTAEMMGIRL